MTVTITETDDATSHHRRTGQCESGSKLVIGSDSLVDTLTLSDVDTTDIVSWNGSAVSGTVTECRPTERGRNIRDTDSDADDAG